MTRLMQGLLLSLLATAVDGVLVNFQVQEPPPLPSSARQCTVKLLERTFGNSYGSPEVVAYAPPSDCGPAGSWVGISLNLTVTSNGTQYDRLGTFSLHSVEFWRTSTPEPTRSGIIWTVTKDVTRFIPLFAKSGPLVFQLDNILTDSLNGQYAATLYATYYSSSSKYPPAPKSDVILPLSTLRTDTGAQGSTPPGLTTLVSIPQNAVAIYAEIQASGNGQEEFWYYNAANKYISDLPDDTTYGQGPYREVRLLVDGKVAGAANPYPVIFTGGIIPTAWRPISAYGALDLPTYFIDVTPFVPLVVDGKPHNFTLDVVSTEDDHSINQNWYLSGSLQVVLDPSSKATTGRMSVYQADDYAITTVSGGKASNGDVSINVKAKRDLKIQSDIISGSGQKSRVLWTQSLSYENQQRYQNGALVQIVQQTSTGVSKSFNNLLPAVVDSYQFPLTINTTTNANGSRFSADFDHSYDRILVPNPRVRGSTIKERQRAGGIFNLSPSGNTGTGYSNNEFNYADLNGNTYDREVRASLNNITYDHQGGTLRPIRSRLVSAPSPQSLPLAGARLPGGKLIKNIIDST